ncbi:flavin reductase family protein [Hahella ganghwensis]|uniref:flavin reductase family protein n=1 Tax=Hahella ganghwensis TaxID=286420 RepID=UPI001461587B|nr:iron-sulfur cluster-binding domain-containing protein [Hahella ganghwensis]
MTTFLTATFHHALSSLTSRLSPLFRIIGGGAREVGERFWQSSGCLQNWIEMTLCEIDPLFSRQRMAAEVIAVLDETAQVKTFVIRPPSRWKGFIEGQHIPVEVEVNGVRMRRFYSISSTQQRYLREGVITITVKHQEHGRVSGFLHERVRTGGILYIGEASGSFTLNHSNPPGDIVFIAAGSGITPIISIIESLGERQPGLAMTLIYYVRNSGQVIFRERLELLSERCHRLNIHLHFTAEEGRASRDQLLRDSPNITASAVYLCGPQLFMQRVIQELKASGSSSPDIRQEHFGGPFLAERTPLPAMDKVTAKVHLQQSGREIESQGGQSLLEIAESHGLQPKFGCRSGVCHECTCVKTGGQVINRLTGELVPEEQEFVQACISIPVGAVTIENW